jgi:hypothetical protein
MAENEKQVRPRPLAEVDAEIARVKAEIQDIETSRAGIVTKIAERLRSKGDSSKIEQEFGTVQAKLAGRAQLLDWLESERYQAIKAAVLNNHRALLERRRQLHQEERQARVEFGEVQRKLAEVGGRVARAQHQRMAIQQLLSNGSLDVAAQAGLDGETITRLRGELRQPLAEVDAANQVEDERHFHDLEITTGADRRKSQ